MNNLKNFETFNEELTNATYSNIIRTAKGRNDPRGNRISNTAKNLMFRNSPPITLYNKTGNVVNTFRPDEKIKRGEDWYQIFSIENSEYIILTDTGVNSTWLCSYSGNSNESEQRQIFFDVKGRNTIFKILGDSALVKKSQIPAI